MLNQLHALRCLLQHCTNSWACFSTARSTALLYRIARTLTLLNRHARSITWAFICTRLWSGSFTLMCLNVCPVLTSRDQLCWLTEHVLSVHDHFGSRNTSIRIRIRGRVLGGSFYAHSKQSTFNHSFIHPFIHSFITTFTNEHQTARWLMLRGRRHRTLQSAAAKVGRRQTAREPETARHSPTQDC